VLLQSSPTRSTGLLRITKSTSLLNLLLRLLLLLPLLPLLLLPMRTNSWLSISRAVERRAGYQDII